MSQSSKRERVDAALKGEPVDRLPVTAWRHFVADERRADTLARASLKYFYEYDWDWMKLNPRATYYAEAWGNEYDYNHYDHVYPERISGPLNSPADLEKIKPVSGTEGVFAEQLELVRLIKAGIWGAHFIQTVFSPLSVLAFLAARPQRHSAKAAVQAQQDGVAQFIRENPSGAHEALGHIATTLTHYAAATVEAGASGLFFAIVKLARQGVITEAEFEEFGKPYDLKVLNAVQGAPYNLLHSCGSDVYFDALLDYPVHALNWASIGQHNPTITQAAQRSRLALVGGVDEDGVLQTGTPHQVTEEALAAIQATGGKRFLLAPGCGTQAGVPAANLLALRRAAELVSVA
jgi:uroporphyrinogen decarboxylase